MMINPKNFILLLCATLIGCATSNVVVKDKDVPEGRRELLVYASAENPPSWIYEEPEGDKECYYFVGLSGKKDEERDARYDAFRDGAVKTANFIGADVSVIYESLKTSYNLSSEITDPAIAPKEQERQMVEAYFSRFKAQNWYIERYEIQLADKTTIGTYWKAYVRASIPKKEIDEAQKRIKGIEKEPERVLAPKKDVKVIVLVAEKNLGKDMDESIVGNELSSRLFEAGYRVIADQDIGKANVEKLRMAIQEERIFSLRSEYSNLADLIVTGNCSTRANSKNQYGLIVTSADVYIKVISLSSGQIIAQENRVGLAGFGQTSEEAGINALKKAGEVVGRAIIRQMEQAQSEEK